MSTETQQKPSRYRALRGKSVSESRYAIDQALSEKNDEKENELHELPQQKSALGFTSRSFKRRSKSLGGFDEDAASVLPAFPPIPPVPSLPLTRKESNILSRPRPPKAAARTAILASPRLPFVEPILHQHQLEHQDITDSLVPVATAVTSDTAVDGRYEAEGQRREREERSWKEDQDRSRKEEAEAARWADVVARLEAENDAILAEQKKKDFLRLHQQIIATQTSAMLQSKPRSPVLEKFNFLNRGRRSQAATLSPTSSATASVDFSRAQSLEPTLSPRTFLEPGGTFSMTPPQSPMSSYHQHQDTDRRVTVRCRDTSMNFSVVPETTTVDILFQCSDSMDHPINTATSIILEHYANGQLMLDRRLRRYERIRYVLNTWDRDTQNSLQIIPSRGSFDSDKDLDISSVPRTESPTSGFVLQLYHSQRPGKWNKRYITLLENGQIFSSKKSDPNPTDKDVLSLCHLSDYDIYTPSNAASQPKSTLKPPKKYVYAIKSQQKTTVFDHSQVANSNFVHFFCTDDPTIAHQFHSLVHAWRSWYIVKFQQDNQVPVQEIVVKKTPVDPPPQIMPVKHKPQKSISYVKVNNGHRLRVSVDETPYPIGEFQPLIDLQRFEKPIEEFGKDWIPDSSRQSTMPPIGTAIGVASTTPLATPTEEQTFASKGLMGEGYDQRLKEPKQVAAAPQEQAQQLVTEVEQAVAAVAITTASTAEEATAKPPQPEPSSWFPSASAHTAKVRKEQERLNPARPSTSSGVSSSHEQLHGHPQYAHHAQQQYYAQQQQQQRARRGPPKPQPLVHSKETHQQRPPAQNGHGVAAKSPNSLQPPPIPRGMLARRDAPDARGVPTNALGVRTAAGRPSTSGGEPRQGRARSNTAGGGVGMSQRRGGPPEVALPPVPPMPANVPAGVMRPPAREGGGGGGGSGSGLGSGDYHAHGFPCVPTHGLRGGSDRGRDPRPREMAGLREQGRSLTARH